jgi:hypothetical protein
VTTEETDETSEAIEINRDVDCMIYAGRYGKLAGSPAAQFYVTLVLDAATQSRLAGILGANLKGQVTVHFVNVQPPLPDEEDEDEDDAPQNQGRMFTGQGSAGIEGIIVDGAAFLPHLFVASAGNEDICSTCTTHRVTAIHIGQGVAEDLTPDQRREQFAGRPFEHSFYASDDDNNTCMICGAEDPDDSAHVTESEISAKAQLAARQRRS